MANAPNLTSRKSRIFSAKLLCNTTYRLKVCWLANARQERGADEHTKDYVVVCY